MTTRKKAAKKPSRIQFTTVSQRQWQELLQTWLCWRSTRRNKTKKL